MKSGLPVKVSIVVPAYNVEAYLKVCLDSLLAQTLKEIEILVIDDGSTDRTGHIADEYACRDFRVKVVHQENRGLAVARNRGMELAAGKYLAFVDSDDWVKKDAYERLYKRAESEGADMVLGSIVCYEQGKEGKCMGEYAPVFGRDRVINGKECFRRLTRTGYYLPMVFMNLYRTEFINGHVLRFKYQYHEDEYFTPYAFYYAQTVTELSGAFYYYRSRESSIMQSADKRIRAECYCCIANDLFDFAGELRGKESKEMLGVLLLRAIFLYLSAVKICPFLLLSFKCYQLRLWKEDLGKREYQRLKKMYIYLMNQQRIRLFTGN